jgi:hypothetical protein
VRSSSNLQDKATPHIRAQQQQLLLLLSALGLLRSLLLLLLPTAGLFTSHVHR